MTDRSSDDARRGKPSLRWWFFPALLLVTALGCLAVTEAAVRLFWSPDHPRQPMIYNFDNDVALTLVPGQYQLPFRRCLGEPAECKDVSVRFSVNQQGFRGTAAPRHPAGKPLIAVVGDSMVEAAQVDDDETASVVLENNLRGSFPNVEVRNCGVKSTGFVHYYQRWRKFIAPMHPDVLVVAALGLNDFRNCSTVLENYSATRPHYAIAPDGARSVRFDPPPDLTSPARRFFSKVTETGRFVQWLQAVREERRHSFPYGAGEGLFEDMQVYEEPPSTDYVEAFDLGQKYLTQLIREATAGGSRVIVVYLPWAGEAIDSDWAKLATAYERAQSKSHLNRSRPEEIVRRTVESTGAEFISFSDAVEKLSPERQRLLWNVKTDLHLSAEGNRLLGETLAAAIASVPDLKQQMPEAR
ncbi:MAG: hypothetical protein ABR577_05515 [Pyrinomonadaceae bacterium]